MIQELSTFVEDHIWVADYPIRYMGTRFNARMTVVRLADGGLLVHSPCELDDRLAEAVRALGPVRYIVAPGNFHYFHVASCQRAFPEAATWLCPGVEAKCADISYDGLLGGERDRPWGEEIDQVLMVGCKTMWEVALFIRSSRTLLLVDLIENFRDETPGTNWALRAWFKGVFQMWNRPRFAPEYRLGWGDKAAARGCLERILAWDFERIVVSHGELIVDDAKGTARRAWSEMLG